jgi:hypothetical protein
VSRYGIVGATSNDLLTLSGRVIVHNDRSELEWLFPTSRVVRVSDGDLGAPAMRLADHPRFVEQGIRFPLDRRQFVEL